MALRRSNDAGEPYEVSYWDFFSQSPAAAPTLEIHCIEFKTSKDAVDASGHPLAYTRDVTIFADIVTIDGLLAAPGKKVIVVARIINFASGKIDVSGMARQTPNGAPKGTTVTYPVSERGHDGTYPSDPESAGDKPLVPQFGSLNGTDGGSIELWAEQIYGQGSCLAFGGSGAKGQDGGDGAPGATGPYGGDGENNAPTCRAGGVGSRGGKGGQAGAGGDGGAAGKAGSIVIRAVYGLNFGFVATPLSQLKVHYSRQSLQFDVDLALDTRGSTGGQAGNAGEAGQLGGPGQGGKSYVQKTVPGGHGSDRIICAENGRSPSGPIGELGDGPDRAPVAGSGTPDNRPDIKPTTYDELGAKWNVDHLAMLMHRIELQYLNAHYANCNILALWMQNLTGVCAPNATGNCSPQLKPIYEQASAVIKQLRQGLDYYGKAPTYVPLRQLADIDKEVQRALTTGKAVEDAFFMYFQKDQAAKTMFDNLNANLDSVQDSIASITAELKRIVDERGPLEDHLEQLSQEMDHLLTEIQKEHSQFVQAVLKDTGCQSFIDTVIALGMVVSVVASAGTTIGAIAGATQVLLPGSHHGPKDRVESVTKITGGVKELQDDYQKLKAAFSPATIADLDFTKLAMEQKQYDDFLAKYQGIAVANALKDLVDKYFDFNQQRNLRLLEYSASFNDEVRLTQQKEALQAKGDSIKNQLTGAGEEAAQSADAATFMGTLYLEAKQNICRALWNKRKALEYALLMDVEFSVADMNVAALTKKDGDFQDVVGRFQDESKTRYLPFQIPVTLLLVRSTSDVKHLGREFQSMPTLAIGDAFTRFTSGNDGKLLFTVPRGPGGAFPQGWSSIRLSGIDVRLIGVKIPSGYGPPTIVLEATHLGSSQILSPKNEVRWCTHSPVVGSVSYSLHAPQIGTTSVNLVGNGELGNYVGVSPFAGWQLRVYGQAADSSHKPVLPTLKSVQAIELAFFGVLQGFDPA